MILTRRRLDAIIEALTARLAGPIEDNRRDYDEALEWARKRQQRLAQLKGMLPRKRP